MHYVSTRDSSRRLTASQAIVEGLSRDGGLYLPESIPQLTLADIRALARLSYPERAAKIMKLYLEEFSEEELLGFAQKAYGPAKFDTPAAAPVVQLADNTYIQELWHGPTCAFKDMALQMLPYLLTASLQQDRRGEDRLHPRRHLRRHRQGRARGLPGRGPHEDPRLLPRRRRVGDPEAADGHAGGRQRRRVRRARQL